MTDFLEAPGLRAWGFLCLSLHRRAPNRQQAPTLVKWSRRPFWGCRRCGKPRPAVGLAGRGAWMLPYGPAHLFEDQFPILLEYTEAFREPLERTLRQVLGLSGVKRVLEYYPLANDVGL